MGCRCCKMIQSYLFDPVQVPSPGFVNEASSYKLDAEDTVRLKDKWSSEGLERTQGLHNEGVRRTGSRSPAASPPEPRSPHPGAPPQGGPAGHHWGLKAADGVNGVGPAATLQPSGDPWVAPQGRGSLASSAHDVHPALLALEGGDAWSDTWPASEEPPVTASGDARAPSEMDSPAGDADLPDHVFQLPAPDYPPLESSAPAIADREESGCLLGDHTTQDPAMEGQLERRCPRVLAAPGRKESCDPCPQPAGPRVARLCFGEDRPACAPPASAGRQGPGREGVGGGDMGDLGDEDAAVAEALAALEAATAGEDLEEAD
ncbi:uncharacterized protein C4orf19 homolog [Echinops telfairi]|uniref:Uncharacterized protein C4orf19 homolog n=3 Tax=Echinops telfairi TaxID=9371 RepID=A0ABM0IRZ2_ECHTE|nr:uncharacterized protein C4orf19 homolog [Echinops telfairi]XP_045140145.1 uncharacterized protein C4orf19 homolog [Echinops telfairi]XP_045140146.1 uncharacterized protein C4orf19 homolog [Echinops telfairi]